MSGLGYYVHHVGHGHLHRASAVAAALDAAGERVTGLSSLPAPDGWPGKWVRLGPDQSDEPLDPTAHDRLHWAPLGHPGLRARMAAVSAWIAETAPRAVVVDVSVEVAALVRLHGVPVVTVVGPGERGDRAHLLGFQLTSALVGCWPAEATGMVRGLPPDLLARVRPVGAISRYAVAPAADRRPGPRRVVLLAGSGGHGLTRAGLDRARATSPEWEWTVLDRDLGTWVADPWSVVRDADVVVTHAGQNALAEVAASRTPALVLPQERPHREQETTAEVLRFGGWPAVVLPAWPQEGWGERLEQAARLDGADWATWCDGHAAERLAAVVQEVAS